MPQYFISHYWKPNIWTKKNSIPSSFIEGHHEYLIILRFLIGENIHFFPLKSSSCLCKQTWSRNVSRFKNTSACDSEHMKFINYFRKLKSLHQYSQDFILAFLGYPDYFIINNIFKRKKVFSLFFFIYKIHPERMRSDVLK